MMKLTLILISLAGICSERVTLNRKAPSATYQEPVISTTCGEVLNSRSGTLDYKSNETYSLRERCIWTIRIPDALQISFDLVQSGFLDHDAQDGLLLTMIQKSNGTTNGSPDSQLLNSRYLREPTSESIVMDGNIAIVVFHTNRDFNNGKGFILNFQGLGEGMPMYSNKSTDYIAYAKIGYPDVLTYPFPNTSDTYDNNELSTFIINHQNNYCGDFTRQMEVRFRPGGLEAECADVLDLYSLTIGEGWSGPVRICTEDDSGTDIYNYFDSILFIFTSNEQITSTGFSIEYLHQGGAGC